MKKEKLYLVLNYIELLSDDKTFEGWALEEKQAYLTACISIKTFIKEQLEEVIK